MRPRPRAASIGLCSLALGWLAFGCNSGGSSSHDAGVDRPDSAADSGIDTPVDTGVDKPAGTDARDTAPADVRTFDVDYDAAPCQPKYTSCAGLCGTVLDVCTGETFSCGGCETGLACDPALHQCTTPKGTCTALGAECGRIRNSCGTVLDCGACPAGKECDADTNRCVACTLPASTADACKAMGIACGKAWLGCGPSTEANKTDCGTCPDGFVCNSLFNACEPAPAPSGTCTPMTKTQACADRGNQCAFVTDGCGGSVDCGVCTTGYECGTAGVANRCNLPPTSSECALQGRVCGPATDVCGTTVSCGTCPSGYLCTSAGQCEAKCAPKTCADLPGVCGWKVPDTCGGTLSCYDCWKTGQQCGPLTDGVGVCCSVPTALPTGWACGTVTNECGSKDFPCPNGQGCNASHQCCTLPTASDLPSGAVCGTVTNSCGSLTVSCPPGQACKSGQCCTLPTKPTDGSCGTITNSCGSVDYWCSNGQECVSGKCKNTCWGTYGGKCGVSLPDGLGGTINCPCSGTGNVCSVTQAGATGTCSCPTQKSCADYAGRCGSLDGGCGATITCGCTGAHDTCGGGGTAGVCGCTKKTCAGTCGSIDDGCGGILTCSPC